MRQLPLAIGVDSVPSFDSFVPGRNDAALQHLKQGISPAAPVYLWGPTGCGKTHLLRAWAGALVEEGARVGWFGPRVALPWSLDPDWVAIIVDDCQDLSGDEQAACFSLFVQAVEQGVRFGAAGRLPPVDLPLREDLRTRLGWGHVFAMQCLGEFDTRAAIRLEADRRGLFLSDEVMAFVMRRFARDMKSMMSLLDHVDRFAMVEKRPVTIGLLRKLLADDEALEVHS